MKCPKCTNGKISVSLKIWGSKEAATSSEIDCVHCDGTGEIDQETADEIEFEKNMWCKCDEHTGPKFWDDGQHPEIHKHHYRCTTCQGVVQIG